jgi:hypothetical protein
MLNNGVYNYLLITGKTDLVLCTDWISCQFFCLYSPLFAEGRGTNPFWWILFLQKHILYVPYRLRLSTGVLAAVFTVYWYRLSWTKSLVVFLNFTFLQWFSTVGTSKKIPLLIVWVGAMCAHNAPNSSITQPAKANGFDATYVLCCWR